jgi:hypothetical protein
MHFMRQHLIFILILFIAVASFSGCDKSLEKKPPNYPEALILLPNAIDVKYYPLGGSFQLTYKIKANYPATELIETISTKLKQDKWNALKEDCLNPGLPSGHIRGWTSFEDATKKPTQTVHQWLADWENESGDILRYGFQYRYEKNKNENLNNLIVTAIFIPVTLAKQGRDAANEFKKK